MEYALMTEPQAGGSYDDLLRLASWAEQRGLAAFARSDHYLDMQASRHATDALASLAGLARDTDRIRLTVLVSPVTFRTPSVLAKTAATIDEMSGGRLDLGIGTGWMETEHDAFGVPLLSIAERFSRLAEALRYVRAALGKDEGGFRGEHYSLDDIAVLPRPSGPLPIIVGGAGEKRTPALAGRYADEFNVFAVDLEKVRARIEVMRQSAAAAGRDPESIVVSIMTPVVVGADETEYRDVLRAEAERRDLEPGEFEEQLRSRGRPYGTADQVAEYMASRAEAGISRIYVQDYRDLGDIDTDRLAVLFDLLPT